jgi:hypothetical protein
MGPKRRQPVANLRRIISQKSEGLNYTAEEAWNLARCGCFILISQFEDGTDTLSRNVSNQLPNYVAYHRKRAKASTIPQRKPGTSQDVVAFYN